jgi:hypothetical protein
MSGRIMQLLHSIRITGRKALILFEGAAEVMHLMSLRTQPCGRTT